MSVNATEINKTKISSDSQYLVEKLAEYEEIFDAIMTKQEEMINKLDQLEKNTTPPQYIPLSEKEITERIIYHLSELKKFGINIGFQ